MELLEAIKWAGVVGEGGAGFPTYAKLDTRAECFIVNGAECEPLIETDKYLMRTFPDEIVAGTAAVSAHLGAKRTVIALKSKYKAESEALSRAIEKSGAAIEIVKMPAFYPAGDEHTMVYYVTGRSIPARGIPISVGCVVDNVGTMRSVYEALEGRPVTDKYLSVTGDVREPVMLRVPIGTYFRECVALAGTGLSEYAAVNGGPMMGLVLSEKEKIDAAVVTKTTGNILVLPPDHYLVERSKLKMQRIRLQRLHTVPLLHRPLPALAHRAGDGAPPGDARAVDGEPDKRRRGIRARLRRRDELLQLRDMRTLRLSDEPLAAPRQRILQRSIALARP